MNHTIYRAGLDKIADKVMLAQRLTPEEGLQLYACRDLQALGYLANIVRERKNGNTATYIFNHYLNYSNVCVLSCQFCAFARKPGQDGAFSRPVEELVAEARSAKARGATEIHMVGGLHPKLPFSYYTELVSALSATGMMIKAFTAIEIRHLAERIAKKPISFVLETLRDCGLYSLTGGGAEIFDPQVRDKICRGKETAEEWAEVHRLWHQMGMRSTCTMLYGHIEAHAHRIDHLTRLRDLQDRTGLPDLSRLPSSRRRPSWPIFPVLRGLKTCAIWPWPGSIWITLTISPPTGSAWACRWRRWRSPMASMTCTAQSGRKKSFTWPGLKRRWNRPSPRWSGPSEKPDAYRPSAIHIIA
jgi:biotin synthase-like enzyme